MKTVDLWSLVRLLREEGSSTGGLVHLSAAEREARLFAYVLERLPIGFERGESLAGDFGPQYIDPCAAEELVRKTEQSPSQKTAPPVSHPDLFHLLDQHFHCRAGYTPAHTCSDYQRLIEQGIDGILQDVRLARVGASNEQLDMLHGMEIALHALIQWANRYAQLASRLATSEKDLRARQALEMITRTCRRVPQHPARTFHEAVQSIWLVHAAIGISEMSEASLSLGRPDQYLYPLFAKDVKAGISDDDIEGTLVDLWRKLNRFGDPACAINLGGVDPSGRDLFNPLSAMMIRVTKMLRLPAPILAARIHGGLPVKIFDMYVDPELFTLGQPTFYGERPCREAMIRRGVPPDEAHRFAANSCMGLLMPGEEISDMWGAVVNLLLPLELALNHGNPFQQDLPTEFDIPPQREYATFNELFDRFSLYLDKLVELMVKRNWESTQRAGMDRPNPLFSALIRDCIARGRDRAMGGARYHIITVEGFGWVTAADALTAIQQIVFDESGRSIEELVSAAQRNFENDGDLLGAILRCPKFGNAEPEADAMACRVADAFARSVRRHSHGRFHYAPSFHTLNAHISAGKKVGASLDGRKAGEPLGKNMGPMPGRTRKDLTSLLLSASAIDQAALSGGQALDISIAPAIIKSDEGRRKFESLLLTYFDRGGLQIQVNAVTADQLRQAMADPSVHRDIIVKVAGYSARFVTLSRDIQEEMVERFEQGL